ncbi:MAG: ribonuclease H family protein [Polyangiaceae bacterium]|nr:ribonuclease H family protein [Polyangiaceae bacterium]
MTTTRKKYYAVKGTVAPAVCATWPACQRLVHGVKGALFKGFATRAEAEAWLEDRGTASESAGDGEVLVYVDGSFSPAAGPHAGWGFVVVKDNQELFAASGRTLGPALSRNVDGELEATIQAIDWCCAQGYRAVVCHDYEGVGRWALGEWKASSTVAKRYQERLRGKLDGIRFCKVSAHTGHRWNDRADTLAKQGIGMS